MSVAEDYLGVVTEKLRNSGGAISEIEYKDLVQKLKLAESNSITVPSIWGRISDKLQETKSELERIGKTKGYT